MADSILRLRVESQEYDSKLKRAAEGIQRYADECRKAGGTLTELDDGVEEFVRGLGEMDTVSRTAKGSVAEMTKAFTDLSVQYNKLTDEEKNSPFGQALSASLDQLKGRIQSGDTELKNIKNSLNDTGGILGQLKDKLVVNIDALKLFQVGLSAAKAVADMAKDAFFNNEQQLDEWGRVVESSESLYKGFLTALNTGDISGYLKNIDAITQAARAAYDALDALNTFNAFNQINVEKTRTGMTEAIADYRGGTGSKDAVKAAGEAYKKELQERKKLEQEAYIEAVGKVAAERGVSKQDLLTALSGTFGSYQQLKAMPMSGSRTVFYSGGMFGGGGSYEQAFPNSIQERLGDALRRLNDDQLKNLQALGAQAERTGNEIATVDKQLNRVLNARTGGGGGGGGRTGGANTNVPTYAADSIAAQSALVSELTKKWNEAGVEMRNSYLYELIQAENQLKKLKDEQSNLRKQEQSRIDMKAIQTDMGTSLTDSLGLMPTLASIQEKLDANPLVIHIETVQKDVKAITKAASLTAQVVGSIGDAFNQIEDPAAKVAGTVAQAIATITLGYAQATQQAATLGPWAWVAFGATGLAQMLAMAASIHSVTGYADGGEIKGNSFSGDRLMAQGPDGNLIGLNAGEVVLNRAQAGALASSLRSGGGDGGYKPSYVSGEQIWIAMNRYTKRTGRGEVVTWK